MTTDVNAEELSRVIGKIYDCAIDPALWPAALEAMGGLIGAVQGSVSIFDFQRKSVSWASEWGGDPYWMRLYAEKYASMMPFWKIMDLYELGETATTRSLVERIGITEEEFRNSQFFQEWAKPAGYYDVLGCTIMRSQTQMGNFQFYTPPTRDVIGPRDIAIADLLFPHVRRAVLVSDLLDMRSMATAAFEETINTLSAAVVLVDAKSNILHANRAAQAMFTAGGPILSQRGVLGTHDANSVTALRDAIGRAAANESELGYGGIGVPVRNQRDTFSLTPSIAHVLPLKSGTLRPELSLGAAAAVFVTPALEKPLPPFEALAALYDLTPTEARVMIEIASGKNRAETAIALGIADSTVKTHLARVFAKTSTSEQPELAKLVASLTPPIAARGKA